MSLENIYTKFEEKNSEVPKYLIEKIKNKVSKKISEKELEFILNELAIEYENTMISPEESIGVITAQSIGEPATQMTLNTFHFSGVSNIQGLPRLIEIIDLRKNIKDSKMKLYLKNKNISEKEVVKIAQKIKEKALKQFITSSEIDSVENILKLTFDLLELKKYGIEKEELSEIYLKKYLKNMVFEGNKVEIKSNQSSILKDILNMKETILLTSICGIKRIKEVTVIKEEKEFVIVTNGSNLKEINKIEEIDEFRTITNDIVEIYSIYGIEAARSAIINELLEIVTNQGLSINIRHLLLVADMMTHSGIPKGMTRFGLIADKTNVLTKASFETPIKHIVRGSLQNQEDELTSVTENVIANQICYVGTGIPKIKVKK